jgi:hypothetical protein
VRNPRPHPSGVRAEQPSEHYASTVERTMVFGHTYLGKEGVELVFRTRKCTPECKCLNLCSNNLERATQNSTMLAT